jgi:hypothetical protein
VLGTLAWSGDQPASALVLESEAFAVDADDDRLVKDAIEHRHGEHTIAGEGAVSAAESQVRREDHRTAFVALRHDLEERVGLLAGHRQVADLIDDQKLAGVDRSMHGLTVTALTLGGLQHQHQAGRAEEARLVTLLGGEVDKRDREMGRGEWK